MRIHHILCLLTIATISAYDGYLAWIYRASIEELNPVANAIIQVRGMATLIVAKAFGTGAVVSFLLLLTESECWYFRMIPLYVVTAFQVGLLAFLLWG